MTRLFFRVYYIKNFLFAAIKPKIKDHFHAHRLSFWLHLFPQLHASGAANVSPEHHLLDDHDNPHSYAGAVRPVPFALRKSSGAAVTAVPFSASTSLNGSENRMSTSQSDHQSTIEGSTLPTTTANITDSLAVVMEPEGHFTAALSVTIAVGASFLILNILIFAGIYYQRDRNRAEDLQKRMFAVSYIYLLNILCNIVHI